MNYYIVNKDEYKYIFIDMGPVVVGRLFLSLDQNDYLRVAYLSKNDIRDIIGRRKPKDVEDLPRIKKCVLLAMLLENRTVHDISKLY